LLAEVDAAAPGSAFASAVALGTELRTLAGRDFKALAGWAFLAVFMIVVISFRGRLGYSALALLPVVLGSSWALGIWSAAGWKLDLFSLAVLPILLGIGLDDGLHVVHGTTRFGGLRASITSVGHGLLLTTLTTCVGFASLGLSRIPSLRNGGLLIAAGVLACWLSTVLVLPAVESFSQRFK